MKTKPPGDTNELLVQMYALSQEQPMAHFQNTALALLKLVVPFDAAIWGTAATGGDGIDIHSFHLHNKTPDMVAEYEEVKHLDSASSGMFDKPKATQAFDTSSFFDGRDKRLIRNFMTKFEQPHFLLSTDLKAQAEDNAYLLHWLTLYQTKKNAYYNKTDVARLHLFAPHLKQALALNRTLQLNNLALRGEGKGGSRLPYAIGIADLKGNLYVHDILFLTLVSKVCGEDYARSTRLPSGLTAQLAEGEKSFVWRHLVVQCHTEHGLIIVKLREKRPADILTEREKDIARLIAKGLTYKQIAAKLGKATATVRNQIQTIYNKLQVNSIAELISNLPDRF